MWEEWALKFLAGAGMVVDGAKAGQLVGELFNVIVADIRAGLYTPDLMEYAYLLAAGVMAKNPTMRLEFQAELIADGIRMLTLNPTVAKPVEPMSVAALTAVSLARAGFSGVISPRE
ncbi:MAG: hypothetical protein ABI629_08840 [bacterium]